MSNGDRPISGLAKIVAPPYPPAFTHPTTGAMIEILNTQDVTMAVTGTNSRIAPGDLIMGFLAAGTNITLTETAGIVTISAASGGGGVPGGSSGQIQTNNGAGGFGALPVPLPVPSGGTGLASLTANAVMLGAGAGTPSFATIGTAGRVLIDQGAGSDPTFRIVSGDVAVSQLGVATIQPGSVTLAKQAAFNAVSLMGNPTGSSTTPSPITLGANLSFSGTTLVATAGGGMSNPMTTTGDLIYGTTTGSPSSPGRLGIGSAGNVLTATGGLPAWASPTVGAANITGTVAITQGGTGQTTATAAFNALDPLTTLGDMIYEDNTPSAVRLPGNVTTTNKFLSQAGTGAVSAAPAWNTIVAGDVPNLPASKITSGQVPVAQGGTGLGTLTANAVILGEGTSSPGFATIGTAGRILIDKGAGIDPAFTAMSGDVAITSGGATTIQPASVTLAKQANFAAAALMGNPTGSSATPSAITLGANLSFSGTTLVAAGGGGGTPGGSTTQLQYNNAGAFGGAAGLTTDGTSLTCGEASNVILGTTTGTKIGTTTSQKLGFFSATPIIRPSGNLLTGISDLGLVNAPTIAEADVTGLVTDLAAKATDSLVVHLAGVETITGAKTFSANVTHAEAANIVLGTTTGSMLATTTSQKLGFFGASPIIRPTGNLITGVTNLGLVSAPTIAESDVTNLTADLAARATDTLVVHLAGTETITGAKTFSANMTHGEAANIVLGTTTGTKIGTATSQKLGFFNATPIVQPSGNIITSLGNLGLVASGTITESDVTSLVSDLALKAPLASPTFTGTPAAPTPVSTDNTTKLATTAFVKSIGYTIPSQVLAGPMAGGRLTLSSTDPYPVSDITGASAGTIYYIPYVSDKILLYNTTLSSYELVATPASGLSLSGKSSGSNYDVFVVNNLDGTSLLALSTAWTNATTRATGLYAANGMFFRGSGSSDIVARWIGSLRIAATGQSESSDISRFVWNKYNQLTMRSLVIWISSSWTWTVNAGGVVAYRPSGNDANQLRAAMMLGDTVFIDMVYSAFVICPGPGTNSGIGVSLDQTTGWTPASGSFSTFNQGTTLGLMLFSSYKATLPFGYHWITGLDAVYSTTSTTTTYGAGPLFVITFMG